MSRYSPRQVALAAELLADKLISTYRDQQIPAMVEGFAAAGFTRAGLQDDPVKLFQMLVIAAYDRRPFTAAAGGFEMVWGIKQRDGAIPAALTALSLFAPERVQSLSQHEVLRRLESRPWRGLSLATDGENVQFARTLSDAAKLVADGLHGQLLNARTGGDARDLYNSFTSVHGIGDTIGAKLVKYLLREIGVGEVPPEAFPLGVVWPITSEYHVGAAIGLLSARLDGTLVPLTIACLAERGDSYAIDGLFYLNRHKRWEIEEFIEEMISTLVGWSGPSVAPPPAATPVRDPDARLAKELLAIIREIYDACRDISDAELKRAGLHGIVSSQQIEGSGRWLYVEMGKLAAQGKSGEMASFYENCLRSSKGGKIGWALGRLGCKSMESEAERFRAICAGRST